MQKNCQIAEMHKIVNFLKIAKNRGCGGTGSHKEITRNKIQHINKIIAKFATGI